MLPPVLGDPVTLGQVTFGETDAFGVQWVLSKLGGWSDGVESTGEGTQRAGADGLWLSPANLAGRVLTVEGALFASDWYDAEDALARLRASIPLSLLGTLRVGGNVGQEVMVRQEGALLVEGYGAERRFSFSLIAPDPRRYSVDEVSVSTGLPSTEGGLSLPISLPVSIDATLLSGSLTVANEGDLPTPPRFTLTGPVPAGARITLAGSGASLLVPDAVASGRSLVIDAGEQSAVLDGVAARRVVGTWFSLPPGESTVLFSAPVYNAGSLLTLTYRSAWR